MRAMVLIRADGAEPGSRPDGTWVVAMRRFNADLVQAGILLATERLRPSGDGVRIRPVGESHAQVMSTSASAVSPVAGFWLWQVRSIEEAMEWARRAPDRHEGAIELEIRQVIEPGKHPDAAR